MAGKEEAFDTLRERVLENWVVEIWCLEWRKKLRPTKRVPQGVSTKLKV